LGLLLAVAGALVGCLEGREPVEAGAGGAELAEEMAVEAFGTEEPATPDVLAIPDAKAFESPVLTVDAADRSLCRVLAERERRCSDDDTQPVAFGVEACAERYACSRQLWRADVQEGVYDCLQELHCDEVDPEFTCLADAAAAVEPSAAERRFEQEADGANDLCGALVEVAPGQSDLVYDALTFCLTENESCDAKAACSLATLQALVDEICGSTVDDEPGQDA